jgi:hypothetical protein
MSTEKQTESPQTSDPAVGSSDWLGVGTRVRFLKTLAAPACEDHPGCQYAACGEYGTIAGHGTREGYWVKVDSWPFAFGAARDEFEVVTPNA